MKVKINQEISKSNVSYNLFLGVTKLFITITKMRRAHRSCMVGRTTIILGTGRINGHLRIFKSLKYIDFIFINEAIAIYVLVHIEACILH